MNRLLRLALEAAGRGYSPDRVVADPEINAAFLAECRRRGLLQTDAELNRLLLNLRKCGELSDYRSRRTMIRDLGEYRFAAEMTARFLERQHSTSLDNILCDPVLASEFDRLATELCPGPSPFEYRWVALGLRKSRRLQPELLARISPPTKVIRWPVTSLQVEQVPAEQGLYSFLTSSTSLYVGESRNLRTRIKTHLDHSDNKGLARWLWEHGPEEMFLEVQTLEESATVLARRALEKELIRRCQPLFNVDT
jgi:hypothetical protein